MHVVTLLPVAKIVLGTVGAAIVGTVVWGTSRHCRKWMTGGSGSSLPKDGLRYRPMSDGARSEYRYYAGTFNGLYSRFERALQGDASNVREAVGAWGRRLRMLRAAECFKWWTTVFGEAETMPDTALRECANRFFEELLAMGLHAERGPMIARNNPQLVGAFVGEGESCGDSDCQEFEVVDPAWFLGDMVVERGLVRAGNLNNETRKA